LSRTIEKESTVAEPRRVRADAERNRDAILAATEKLLEDNDPGQVTIEQAAAAAGVSKATVFHRFGSRTELMGALIERRAASLQSAVESGPPPLGPGAPPRERLIAFLEALTGLAAQNTGLLTAHDHAVATRKNTTGARQANPVYLAWHAHIAELLRQGRPTLDAPLLAHIILGSLHTDPIVQLVRSGQARRLSAALRDIATALLDC
jgi:AcrR family transcriptional regulator